MMLILTYSFGTVNKYIRYIYFRSSAITSFFLTSISRYYNLYNCILCIWDLIITIWLCLASEGVRLFVEFVCSLRLFMLCMTHCAVSEQTDSCSQRGERFSPADLRTIGDLPAGPREEQPTPYCRGGW